MLYLRICKMREFFSVCTINSVRRYVVYILLKLGSSTIRSLSLVQRFFFVVEYTKLRSRKLFISDSWECINFPNITNFSINRPYENSLPIIYIPLNHKITSIRRARNKVFNYMHISRPFNILLRNYTTLYFRVCHICECAQQTHVKTMPLYKYGCYYVYTLHNIF